LAVGIGVLLDYTADRTLILLRHSLAFLPKPDLVFLLDLPEALAYQRKDDIVSLDFLRARRAVYLQMAHDHDITVLDASANQDHLLRSVSARVIDVIEGDA
jgi:dTMP kinase